MAIMGAMLGVSTPVAFSPPLAAQPVPGIVNAQQCLAPNRYTGQIQAAVHMSGPTKFWAQADWLPNGAPIVIYGNNYFTLPPIMQIFTSMHECGHLSLFTANEFQANCYALKRFSPTVGDFNFLAQFHSAIGVLPPNYGGSGVAFWNGTLAVCN